ncbi:MAG TPA: GtrA family protein [Pseudolabrys sp.]|nr:GtrA family protein [Pseudolabrys sp.]
MIDRLTVAWHERALLLKAVSFGLVGVINAAVDYGVFFLARAALNSSVTAVDVAGKLAVSFHFFTAENWLLIPANVIAWLVAVSGSYVMNSMTTFAAESGRQLRWRSYGTFVVSGIAGMIANTCAVLAAVQFVDVWVAKLIAILVGFVVNFALSHFVVFKARPPNGQ